MKGSLDRESAHREADIGKEAAVSGHAKSEFIPKNELFEN
jgi:hypothetical protein